MSSYPPQLLTDLLRSITPTTNPPSLCSSSTPSSNTGLLVELPRALTTLALHSAQAPIPLEPEGGSLIQCYLPPPSHTLRAVQDACRIVARPDSAPNGPSFSLGVCLGGPTHRTRVSTLTNALGLHSTSDVHQEDGHTSTVEDACLSRSQLYIVNLTPSSTFAASETYVSHYGGRCVECASAGIPPQLQGTVWLSREEVAKALSTVCQDSGVAQEVLRSETAWGQHHAHLWATGCLLELLEQAMPTTTTLHSLIASLPIPCPIPCNSPQCPSSKSEGAENEEGHMGGGGEGIYHLSPHSLQRAVCRRDRTRATLSHHPSSPYTHCETLPDDAIPQVDFSANSDAKGWFSTHAGERLPTEEAGPALVARWARLSDCLLPPLHPTSSLPSHQQQLTKDIPIIMNVPRGTPSHLNLNKPIPCIGHFISLQPFLPPVASDGNSLVAFVVDSMLEQEEDGGGLCYGSAPNPTLSTLRTLCDFSQAPSMFSLHAHFERFQARVPYPLDGGGAGCLRRGLVDLLGPREVDPFAPSGLPTSQPPSLQSRTAVKTLLEGFLPRVLGQHVAKTLILHTFLSHSSCVLSPAASRRLMAVVGGAGYSSATQHHHPSSPSSYSGSPIPSILVLGQEGSGKSLLLSELYEFLSFQSELEEEKPNGGGGGGSRNLPYAPVAVGDGSGSSDLVVVIPPRVGDISHDPSILPPPDIIRSSSITPTTVTRSVHLSRCSGDPIPNQRRIGAPQPMKVDSSNHLQTLQQALYTLISTAHTSTAINPPTLLVDTAHLASPSDLLNLHYLASVHSTPYRAFPLRVASMNPPYSTATWPRGPSTPLLTIATSVVPDAQDTGAESILGRLRRLLPSFPMVCFLDRELHDAYNHSLSNRIGNAHSVSVRNSASVGLRMSTSHDGGSLLRGETGSASLSSFDWEGIGGGNNSAHCGIMKDIQQHLLRCMSNSRGAGSGSVGGSMSMGSGGGGHSFDSVGGGDFDEGAAALKTQSLLATIQNAPLYDYLALQMLTTHIASSAILRDPSAHRSGVHIYEVFATPALYMDIENILVTRFPHLGWQRPANVHLHRDAGTETPQEQVDNADLPTHLSRCLTLIKSRARIDMCGCWEITTPSTIPPTPSGIHTEHPSPTTSQYVSTVAPIHISDGVELYCMAVQAGHWLLGAVSISTTIQEGNDGDQPQGGNCNDESGGGAASNIDAHSANTTSILADVVPISLAASGGIAAASNGGNGGKRGRNAPGAKKLSRKEFIAGLITHLHQSCPPGAAKMFARDRLGTLFGAYSQRCGSVAGVGMRGGVTVPGMDECIHLLTNEGFLLKVGPDSYKLIGNL